MATTEQVPSHTFTYFHLKISSSWNMLCSKYETMDKAQKPSNTGRNIPSSEPFRIDQTHSETSV
jgi:hypothetical protein